jgi:hypothetical protein
MDSLSFYSRQEKNLEDIAICAMKSGFKTYFAPTSVPRLMVEYVFEVGGEDKSGTWAFEPSDLLSASQAEPESLGDFELKAIQELKPISTFYVYFRPYSFPKLLFLMEKVLECFGGWIVSHNTGKHYSIGDIHLLASEWLD